MNNELDNTIKNSGVLFTMKHAEYHAVGYIPELRHTNKRAQQQQGTQFLRTNGKLQEMWVCKLSDTQPWFDKLYSVPIYDHFLKELAYPE